MLWLLACSPDSTSYTSIVPSASSTVTADTADTADTGDTAAPTPQPDETVDVLVIGSGPAGLSAAHAATEAGASVVVLERAEQAGGAGWYGSGFFAVGTDAQVDQGIHDTPDAALAEWADFTAGGRGDDPQVAAFVEGAAEVVDWLASLGAVVQLNAVDAGAGSIARVHTITSADGSGPVGLLIPLIEEEIRTGVTATGLVQDDSGAVIGAAYETGDGETGWIAAGGVVVATGGFARHLDRLLADRPELAGVDWVAEAAHTTDGGGHDLLEAVGVPLVNAGSQGVYVHAIPDHREGHTGEALWPTTLVHAMIVDATGARHHDESYLGSFQLIDWLLEAPDQQLWAVQRQARFQSSQVMVPAYNWAERGAAEVLTGESVLTAHQTVTYDSPAALAAGEGIDVDGLVATVATYDEGAETGIDALGKRPDALESLGDQPIIALPLVAGVAKSFGGVQTDSSGAVLGADGATIPGLYAAGEVAGMLGTPAIGEGFSGSVAACYFTGLRAGEAAAKKK